MEFSPGTAVLLVGWGVVLFVLWNLHRFAKAFSASVFWKTAAVFTLALLALGAWLSFKRQRHAVSPRVLVFPLVEKSAAGDSLNALGFAFADQLTAALHAAGTPQFHPLPAAAVFAFADPDSLIFADYALRFARALDLPALAFGEYRRTAQGLQAQIRLLDPSRGETLLQAQAAAAEPTNVSAAAAALGEKLCRHFGLKQTNSHATNGASAFAWPQQNAYYAAYFSLLQQRPEEALRQAAALARADSATPAFVALAARARLQHLRNQRASEAEWKSSLASLIPQLQKAVQRDSLHAPLYVLLSECHLQLKKWKEAENMLRRAQALDPRHARIYVLLARLHASRFAHYGFDSELELYQHALKLNPLEMDAMLGAVEYYLQANRRNEAEALLEKYRRLNPNHLPTLMALGRISIERGDMARTLPLFETIVRLDPRNAEAFYNLGIAYYHQNDLANAARFFERAQQLANYPEAHLYLAQICEKRGDTTAAIAHLRERIRLGRGEDDVYAAEARRHLYGLLLRRGEIPGHLLPDTVQKK